MFNPINLWVILQPLYILLTCDIMLNPINACLNLQPLQILLASWRKMVNILYLFVLCLQTDCSDHHPNSSRSRLGSPGSPPPIICCCKTGIPSLSGRNVGGWDCLSPDSWLPLALGLYAGVICYFLVWTKQEQIIDCTMYCLAYFSVSRQLHTTELNWNTWMELLFKLFNTHFSLAFYIFVLPPW